MRAIFVVYIVKYKQSRSINYYTGYTERGNTRFREHAEGNGAKCLKGKQIQGFSIIKSFFVRSEAMKYEREVKKLKKKMKAIMYTGGQLISMNDLNKITLTSNDSEVKDH